MDRQRRHSVVASLVRAGLATSQHALRERLAERGIEVTQATLSRDLRDLGAVKGHDGYSLQAESSGEPSIGALERVLGDHVTELREAGQIVVLKTGPGRAQIVAFELDRFPLEGVVGTIAGDDTVFVCTPSAGDAIELAGRLGRMIDGRAPADGVQEGGAA